MARPVLDYEVLHVFEPNADVLPAEAFMAFGHAYVGVQTLFPADEEAWDNGDPPAGSRTAPERGLGRWHGPAPLRLKTVLSVEGANYELHGHDDIARIDVGGAANAICELQQRGAETYITTGLHIVLQNAATGMFILDTMPTVNTASSVTQALPSLNPGSYILWARVEMTRASWSLPPDYYSVTGAQNLDAIASRYKFIEDGETRVWDWLYDVGIVPSDPTQVALDGTTVMRDEYQKLVLANALKHRGEWTSYLRSGGANECDWSALRLVVGSGTWMAAPTVLPVPGAAFFKLGANNARTPVALDALARSVTAWDMDAPDDTGESCVLAGSIATRSGPVLALWRLHESGTTELLGTHPNATNNVCEFALLNNFASDTIRDHTGRRLVLTFGGLHEYKPLEPDVRRALPGLPRATEGHPGGRCLRELGSQVFFLTENFSGDAAGEINFYNRLQEQTAGRRTTGPGTVFHGNNCADVLWGDYLGIHQDKPFSDATAQQYIAALRNGRWDKSGGDSFPAATNRWQRVRAVAAAGGLKLMVSGKEATGENAIWGVDDGTEFREAAFPFRPRRLTRTVAPDGTDRLLCVGRFVHDVEITSHGEAATEAQVDLAWSVVELGGEFKKVCLWWDDEEERYAISAEVATAAGLDMAKLPAYLWWENDVDFGGGGVWLQRDNVPNDSRPYLQKVTTGSVIAYVLPPAVAMPYDATVWERICFTVYDDGSGGTDAIPPEPGCDNAACVFPKMPSGTMPLIISKEVDSGMWSAIQVSDVSDLEGASGLPRLAHNMQFWPLLWARVDSTVARDDLASYRQRISFDRFEALSKEANAKIDVCVLVPPAIGTTRVPVMDQRA